MKNSIRTTMTMLGAAMATSVGVRRTRLVSSSISATTKKTQRRTVSQTRLRASKRRRTAASSEVEATSSSVSAVISRRARTEHAPVERREIALVGRLDALEREGELRRAVPLQVGQALLRLIDAG